MNTKIEVITRYQNELNTLRQVYKNSDAVYANVLDKSNSRRKQELALAQRYLHDYPELSDRDCCGRCLPAFEAKILQEYLDGVF